MSEGVLSPIILEEIKMTQTFNQNTDTFNTMHKLERAGMSRTQAEITSRAIDQQISLSRQEVLDKIDERFDVMNERFDERFDVMNERFNERFDVMNERFNVMNERFNERFDVMDKRFDVMNERFVVMNERLDAVEKKFETRFDAVEKRLSWLYVESLVAISVIGVGFCGVIIALLRLG